MRCEQSATEATKAIQADADVLVIGGNCTVALGVMAGLPAGEPRACSTSTGTSTSTHPHSTTDGALDWMGMAHALDLPGAAPELASAFDRTPLLTPAQVAFIGIEPRRPPRSRSRASRHSLHLHWCSSADLTLASPPSWSLTRWSYLPAGPLAVHVDVDVLDFTDAPLAENTDGRNTGPSLATVTQVLEIACHDPRFRALSIGELNPARAAGEPDALLRFIAAVATALRAK